MLPFPQAQAQTTPLRSTAEEIIDQCPRFRILLLGKSGAGKSSLVNKTFNVQLAEVSHNVAGRSDINFEITSDSNPHFVLHDSQGFEPGELENMSKVKNFIVTRRKNPRLQDRLHAIWHVIETPVSGGRILEVGDLEFLKLDLGNIPVITVFTKYDLLLRLFELQFDDDATILAEADRAFRLQCLEPLKAMTKNNHSYARVSMKYDKTVADLVEITRRLLPRGLETSMEDSSSTLVSPICEEAESLPVADPSPPKVPPKDIPPTSSPKKRLRLSFTGSSKTFRLPELISPRNSRRYSVSALNQGPSNTGVSPNAQIPGANSSEDLTQPVALAWAVAQRMNAQVNIDASIAVGRKKYWTTLATSTHFPGHTLEKCLDTIVKDITIVWNFHDPHKNLCSKQFKACLSHLVNDLADPESSKSPPANNLTTGFGQMVNIVGVAVAAAGLAQPITLPIMAGLALAHWAWQVYKQTPGILSCLMAYIVDLTMILHRLFWLMRARGGIGYVTTGLIAYAFKSFSESTAPRIHEEIKSYVDKSYFISHAKPGYALTEIIRLIKSTEFDPLPSYEQWARDEVGKVVETFPDEVWE